MVSTTLASSRATDSSRSNIAGKIVIALLAIMPIVDSLNGITQGAGIQISIGLAYRVVSICVLFIIVGKSIQGGLFRDCLLVMILLSVLSCMHILLGSDIGRELYYLFTWLTFPLFLLVVIEAKQARKICSRDIAALLDFYLWVVPLLLLVPWTLGLGNATYHTGEGYKGFFISTNGVSYYLGILVIYGTWLTVSKFDIKRLVQLGLTIAACLLVGSMSCIFSVVIALVISIVLLIKDNPRKALVRLMAVIVAAGIVWLLAQNLSSELSMIFQRKLFFYASNGGSFIDFLSSGRTQLFAENWSEAFGERPIQTLIIGYGSMARECELDYFDFFLSYGLVGVVGATVIVYYLLHADGGQRAAEYQFLVIYSLAYAGVVGHVFTNAMSSMLFAVIVAHTSESDSDIKRQTILDSAPAKGLRQSAYRRSS